MKPTIVVTRKIHQDALDVLSSLGHVRVWEADHPIFPEVLRDWIGTSDATLTMLTDAIDEHLLSSAPALKVVSNMAVGFDNIDLKAASRHGVMVTNTPDVLTEATAELTWTLMLSLLRGLLTSREALLRDEWRAWRPDGFLGTEVSGKTLGIAGLGRIGRAVARRAPAFNMDVVAVAKPSASAEAGIRRLPRSEFLAQSDVITLHVPLNSDTYHLVNDEWLQAMKPGAFLVNTARGAVIDEWALLRALDSGRLAGAALDVFEQEPVGSQHPLASHPRVLATPHIGSATHETRRAMALRAAENIGQALAGGRPRDLLNPDALSP